jgi:SAM-dependent methyltransferase
MEVDRAIEAVRAAFPFEGYTDAQVDAYRSIAAAVAEHLPPGGRILDVGAGPCDKTAVLARLGYRCAATDDLRDDWHLVPGHREKIQAFAAGAGVDFRPAAAGAGAPSLGEQFAGQQFDMLTLNDVLEHLHDSPRDLLVDLLGLVRPGGLLLVTVPNAVAVRKRVAVVRGRTNLAPFASYYWSQGAWRGHVREYTRGDLAGLACFLGLEVVTLRGCHHMLHKLPAALRPAYRAATAPFQGLKDSWLLVARKPPGWAPERARSRRDPGREPGGPPRCR